MRQGVVTGRGVVTPVGCNLSDFWNSLKTGGTLIIANQGEKEHQAQLKMLQTAHLQVNFPFLK